MIESFIKYLHYEKRYSNHTLIAYKNDINNFFEFASEQFNQNNEQEIDYNCIRSWIIYLLENGIDTRSVNRKIASVKSYYKYLLKMEKISADPTASVISPKSKKNLPVFLGNDSMDQLLDYNLFEDNFEGIRDKSIIEFIYGTGVRLAELISLKHKDIDLNEKHVRVLGKGNKERYIPFNQSVANILDQYVQYKKESGMGVNKEDLFFITKKNKQAYPMLIYRIVNKYLNMVTTQEKKSPHVLRHTFATQLLNKGADINAIKELLGHSSLAATQVYTHNSIEKLKNIYKQAHPKG